MSKRTPEEKALRRRKVYEAKGVLWLEKVNKTIEENKERVRKEARAERPVNQGPKGVAAPDLPDIIESFKDEEAYQAECATEMDRFNAEKQERLSRLFIYYSVKQDDWKGLAMALAEDHVDEYKTNQKPGQKKPSPLMVLERVIRYAVEFKVGVDKASHRVYPKSKHHKVFERARRDNKQFWDQMREDNGL